MSLAVDLVEGFLWLRLCVIKEGEESKDENDSYIYFEHAMNDTLGRLCHLIPNRI